MKSMTPEPFQTGPLLVSTPRIRLSGSTELAEVPSKPDVGSEVILRQAQDDPLSISRGYISVLALAFLLTLSSGIAFSQDSTRTTAQKEKPRADKFIDADGDGICDNRAQGLGFRRGAGLKMQKRTGMTQSPDATTTEGQRKQLRQRGGQK